MILQHQDTPEADDHQDRADPSLKKISGSLWIASMWRAASVTANSAMPMAVVASPLRGQRQLGHAHRITTPAPHQASPAHEGEPDSHHRPCARLRDKARKRERVRCSSLVDWRVYPRLRGTMQTRSNGKSFAILQIAR